MLSKCHVDSMKKEVSLLTKSAVRRALFLPGADRQPMGRCSVSCSKITLHMRSRSPLRFRLHFFRFESTRRHLLCMLVASTSEKKTGPISVRSSYKLVFVRKSQERQCVFSVRCCQGVCVREISCRCNCSPA